MCLNVGLQYLTISEWSFFHIFGTHEETQPSKSTLRFCALTQKRVVSSHVDTISRNQSFPGPLRLELTWKWRQPNVLSMAVHFDPVIQEHIFINSAASQFVHQNVVAARQDHPTDGEKQQTKGMCETYSWSEEIRGTESLLRLSGAYMGWSHWWAKLDYKGSGPGKTKCGCEKVPFLLAAKHHVTLYLCC